MEDGRQMAVPPVSRLLRSGAAPTKFSVSNHRAQPAVFPGWPPPAEDVRFRLEFAVHRKPE